MLDIKHMENLHILKCGLILMDLLWDPPLVCISLYAHCPIQTGGLFTAYAKSYHLDNTYSGAVNVKYLPQERRMLH